VEPVEQPLPSAANLGTMIEQAHRMYASGQYGAVVRLCRDLLRRNPANAPLLLTLGMAELAFDHFDESLAALSRAAAAAPNEARIYLAIAAAERRRGRFPEAHRAVDRALQVRPGDAASLAARATLLCMEGEYQRALDAVSGVVTSETTCSDLAPFQVFGRGCARLGRHAEGIRVLEGALGTAGMTGDRAAALIQLGELLDAAGEFERAFGAFEAAAAIRRRTIQYDATAHRAAVSRTIESWSPERMRAVPESGLRGERLIFIVGMLRSGTTLVEQILASHSKVWAAGERLELGRACAALQPKAAGPLPVLTDLAALTRASLDRQGRELLGAFSRLDSSAARVTDKNPLNFLHLGLIRKMLPGARVIHCIRDPLDTCLSCYFNVSTSIAWASDLGDLGAFYADYRRLMDHWRAVLSDLPVLDVVYEDLVGDPEGHARRIIEFSGLPWEPGCARFHENKRVALTPSIDQVRRPMYTSSVGRWRAYERHLRPLQEALAGSGATR
jgi:tetratricopeptide (TPR) repeat protein